MEAKPVIVAGTFVVIVIAVVIGIYLISNWLGKQ